MLTTSAMYPSTIPPEKNKRPELQTQVNRGIHNWQVAIALDD